MTSKALTLRAQCRMPLNLEWHNGFAQLGPAFANRLHPTPLPAPYWVGHSRAVAQHLALPDGWHTDPQALAMAAGNHVPEGAAPLSSVYSGHQFGVWAGQLGDGRALMLGEVSTPAGGLELQLKGAGRTPYSRGADGRAVLRSSIREFLCSEAMHGLGIPTTRALCISGSDAPILREELETAAVVTRVAPSFIRFGHFEHFANNGLIKELQQLADYVIERYYPSCAQGLPEGHDEAPHLQGNPYAALLQSVSERTARLLAQWQAVGFCHGVMNTDNMSILGLTIDYGPFQFLDGFDPDHICNHSDHQGRYAYNRQPNIAYWNLFCLGQALLPLIGEQDLALAALESYKAVFPQALMARFGTKLGLSDITDNDRTLIDDTLKLLAREKVDFPIFWRRLSHLVQTREPDAVRDLFIEQEAFEHWLLSYSERLTQEDRDLAAAQMFNINPKFVLRNHVGELVIRAAKQKDFKPLQDVLALLENPYQEHPGFESLAGFPPDWAQHIEISCSS